MSRAIPALLVLAAALRLASPAGAAGDDLCDPGLVGSDRSPLAYQLRGNRCEGIYKLEVNSELVKLVGLTESFGPFDPGLPADLKAAWPALPPALAGAEVRLQATSLTAHTYYRMDASVRGVARFDWPLEILDRLRLDADALGVRAFAQHPQPPDPDFERIYLPLRLWQEEPLPPRGSYTVKFVPEVRLQEVFVSLVAADLKGRPTGPAIVANQPLAFGYYPAKTPVELDLPAGFGLSGLGRAGFYRVDLLLQDTIGGSLSYRFLFFHEGSTP